MQILHAVVFSFIEKLNSPCEVPESCRFSMWTKQTYIKGNTKDDPPECQIVRSVTILSGPTEIDNYRHWRQPKGLDKIPKNEITMTSKEQLANKETHFLQQSGKMISQEVKRQLN